MRHDGSGSKAELATAKKRQRVGSGSIQDLGEAGRLKRLSKQGGVKLATVRDVARRAGVSHTTVSRVLNEESLVSQGTRQLVQDAIAALNFKPNTAARVLSSGEQIRISLLHRFPNPGSLGEFLVHLIDHVNKVHAGLVVRKVAGPAAHDAVLRELVDEGVQAVLLPPPLADDEDLVERLHALGIAAVAIGSNRQGGRIASVGVDDRVAARAMTDHLLALGHRRVAFISGHPRYASAGLRLSGFRDAMGHAGLAIEPELVVSGLYTYQSGLAAAEQLFALAERPTAIFASNDDMAAAAVAVAHRLGLHVPRDVSICGFDDSPLATTIWPTLTTVRRPGNEIAEKALTLLFAAMSAGRAPTLQPPQLLLDHILVRRHSDGPAPDGDRGEQGGTDEG